MQDNVYRVIEIVGSSEHGVDDAIRTAIARASSTIRHIRWFEVIQTRGHVEGGAVKHVQVVMKVGFTLDGHGDRRSGIDAVPEPGTDPLHEGP